MVRAADTLETVGLERFDEILVLLRERGGRVTLPRRAIIAALLDARTHVTAERLAEDVQRAHPDIHRATIYRTLVRLSELGVVTHVHLGHGPSLYHLSVDDHHHLVCDQCGTVVELPAGAFDALRRRVERDYGFHIDAHHFALGGRCAHCAEVPAATAARI